MEYGASFNSLGQQLHRGRSGERFDHRQHGRLTPRVAENTLGTLDQRIDMVTQARRFGGCQWYFECPVTHRHCGASWMPPGAHRFGSRQIWRRRVAYSSQFGTPADRAHLGKAKIKSRLIGDCDPDKWDLPPKPKWMRWRTTRRTSRNLTAMRSYSTVCSWTQLYGYQKRDWVRQHISFYELPLTLRPTPSVARNPFLRKRRSFLGRKIIHLLKLMHDCSEHLLAIG